MELVVRKQHVQITTFSVLDSNVVSASYRPILRKGDSDYSLGPVIPVKPGNLITEEMIEVSFLLKNNEVKKDFFVQVYTPSPKYHATEAPEKPGIPLNVLVLGIDSLSDANAIRKLPEVVKFLKENNAMFFKGHTIVGDGTTAQLTAMLTGKHIEEQYEARTGKPGAKPLDDWTWIFRQMKGVFKTNDVILATQFFFVN